MQFETTQAYAAEQDKRNPLAPFRGQFLLPRHNGKAGIYFLGNSLGAQPKRTEAAITEVLQQWAAQGVESFFNGDRPWLDFHKDLQSSLAKIVGALPHEVVVMNQLTVNLHLMLVSFYQPQGKRKKILCEAKAFPSDQYMLHSHVAQRGFSPDEIIIEIGPRDGEALIREDDILTAIDLHKDELSLVFIGGVNYYTGQVFNMGRITKAAQDVGAKAGFDLAHAAGNSPLQLHHWNVDFACWCCYKYLNGGPGAVGGVYVHERYHNDTSLNRFAGWWGVKKQTQFLMEKTFVPEASAEGWGLSTPSAVLYASLQASLSIFEEAGMENIYKENKKLTAYLWAMLDAVLKEVPEGAFKIFTPVNETERGCQLSMSVRNGKQVFEALTSEGVYADWREPDVIRIAPVALYNTFQEVWMFVQIFKTALHKFA